MLFITHDVDEAILLSDVVYVMTARPGRIRTRFDIPLPRPRDLELVTAPEFNAVKREIMAAVRRESLAGLQAQPSR